MLHSGVVVGSDGFGFATSLGKHRKVPQVGGVVIEDDVELGANVCVDRGTLGDVYYARTLWLRRYGMPRFGGWFGQKKLSGGGPLIDLGVHMIDLIMHLAGRPKALRAGCSCTSTFGSPIRKNTPSLRP